ncbi:hypothetical protein D9M68_720530 [compost metagenome]
MGFDDHAGITRLDGAYQPRQPGHGRQFRDADAHVSFHHIRPLELFDCRIPLVEQPFGQQEHLFALFRESGRPQRAVEQRCIEQGFQFLYALGDRRLGRVQPRGRGSEATKLNDPVHGFELLEGDQRSTPFQRKNIVLRHLIRFQFIAFFDLTQHSEFVP